MIPFTSRHRRTPHPPSEVRLKKEVDLRNSANLALRNDEQWLTVRRVANRLDVSADTVRRWIRSKKLTAAQLGGRAGYRIDPDALELFLRKSTPR